MSERQDVEALIDAVDEQVDFDVRRKEAVMAVFQRRSYRVDELLDLWNEEDLEPQPNA
jgi:hypothetical protein